MLDLSKFQTLMQLLSLNSRWDTVFVSLLKIKIVWKQSKQMVCIIDYKATWNFFSAKKVKKKKHLGNLLIFNLWGRKLNHPARQKHMPSSGCSQRFFGHWSLLLFSHRFTFVNSIRRNWSDPEIFRKDLFNNSGFLKKNLDFGHLAPCNCCYFAKLPPHVSPLTIPVT